MDLRPRGEGVERPFFHTPSTCPCCVSPCCEWSPVRRIDEVVEYALFLEDCRRFVLSSPPFSSCSLSLLPEDVVLRVGEAMLERVVKRVD